MYTIIRQKRKSFTIKIEDDLEVIIKVPHSMKEYKVKELIKKYEKWIEETLQKKRLLKEKTDWQITGEILYLGEYRRVRQGLPTNHQPKIVFDQGAFVIIPKPGDGDEMIKEYMEQFYKEEAKKLLTALTEKYAMRMGVKYSHITIRKQKTRWGSCSKRGSLSYNVKLMCAPVEMIEYVVLHEVMHLKHFNHGPEFWRAILEIMPDYKKRRDYFKSYGESFSL